MKKLILMMAFILLLSGCGANNNDETSSEDPEAAITYTDTDAAAVADLWSQIDGCWLIQFFKTGEYVCFSYENDEPQLFYGDMLNERYFTGTIQAFAQLEDDQLLITFLPDDESDTTQQITLRTTTLEGSGVISIKFAENDNDFGDLENMGYQFMAYNHYADQEKARQAWQAE